MPLMMLIVGETLVTLLEITPVPVGPRNDRFPALECFEENISNISRV